MKHVFLGLGIVCWLMAMTIFMFDVTLPPRTVTLFAIGGMSIAFIALALVAKILAAYARD
jgi:hypothetical protein